MFQEHDAVAVDGVEVRVVRSNSLSTASCLEPETLPADVVACIASALSAALLAELREEFGVTVASPGGLNRG